MSVNEHHWLSNTARTQWVKREGVADLFIGGVGNRSQAFYDINDMAMWLLDMGVTIEDPIFDYIETLEVNNENLA